MKLITFSVKNFRSITKTEKISLSNFSVLVGPNNEGKSNILRAIRLALIVLSRNNVINERSRLIRRNFSPNTYNWKIDYPINLQKETNPKPTELFIEMECSENEKSLFKKTIKSNLETGILPINEDVLSSL